jgi:hypothetical protein
VSYNYKRPTGPSNFNLVWGILVCIMAGAAFSTTFLVKDLNLFEDFTIGFTVGTAFMQGIRMLQGKW